MNGTEHYREAERLLAQATDKDGDPSITGAYPTALRAAAQVHATLALAAAHGIDAVAPASERRPRTRITDDHLIDVANVYDAADAAGQGPTRAVADHFDVPHSTAAKWVGRARQRRFLPPVGGEAL